MTPDAPAPRQDLAALARDVDRLFRARQDGRQMPVGERFESAGGWGWVPNPCELRAMRAWAWIDIEKRPSAYHPVQSGVLDTGDKPYYRALRHVAMLALTEPAFFQRRLAEVVRHDPAVARAWDVWEWPDGTETRKRHARFGVVTYDVSPARIAADVASTHRYLVDLDRRLREWREAEARREAVATADAQAAARDRKAAKEAADRADEMAAALENGDLACFEEAA